MTEPIGAGVPIVVVQVPIDGDPLYPSRVMFAADGAWTPHLKSAKQFEDPKEAKKAANRLMHYAKNCLAAPVPFPIAWALWRAAHAPWDKTVDATEPTDDDEAGEFAPGNPNDHGDST